MKTIDKQIDLRYNIYIKNGELWAFLVCFLRFTKACCFLYDTDSSIFGYPMYNPFESAADKCRKSGRFYHKLHEKSHASTYLFV